MQITWTGNPWVDAGRRNYLTGTYPFMQFKIYFCIRKLYVKGNNMKRFYREGLSKPFNRTIMELKLRKAIHHAFTSRPFNLKTAVSRRFTQLCTDFFCKLQKTYFIRKGYRIFYLSSAHVGFMAPFEVTGSPELIETGYEAGFGGKGSMGFGMVKEVTKTGG